MSAPNLFDALPGGAAASVQAESLILFVGERAAADRDLAALDAALGGTLGAMIASGEFTGAPDTSIVIHTLGLLPARRLIVAGIGPLDLLIPDRVRRAAAHAARHLSPTPGRGAVSLGDAAALGPLLAAQLAVEGIRLARYRFDRYRTGADAPSSPVQPLDILCEPGDADAVREGIRRGLAIAGAATLARDLCNEPPNVLTPGRFAEEASRLAAEAGLTAQILDVAEMESLGMGGLLAVARGSREAPAFVIIEYAPPAAAGKAPIVLVGKTVTFDSGGISLKVHLDMHHMKADMTGGAVVLAAVLAAARLGLPERVVVLCPVVENMPGGGAIRPGDIIRMLSGQTVEVLNTDAEGRLILADALHYAGGLNPAITIDVATLTGASAIVFGRHTTAMFGTAPAEMERIRTSGDVAGEALWPMPLAPAYAAELKSHVADFRNIAGQQGAMLIAAAFLHGFVGTQPWIHLDIYSGCWNELEHPYLPKGPTAITARLLVQYLIDRVAPPPSQPQSLQ